MTRNSQRLDTLTRQVASLTARAAAGDRLTALSAASMHRLHGLPSGIQSLLQAASLSEGTPVSGRTAAEAGMQHYVGDLVLTVYPFAGQYGQFVIGGNGTSVVEQRFDFANPASDGADVAPVDLLQVIGLGVVAANPALGQGSPYLAASLAQLTKAPAA